MATAFQRDTAVRRAAAVSFVGAVSETWRAGRAPHGGYLAALILRGLIETVDDAGRSPRSLTVHYARAPQPGPVRLTTTVERAGRSLSTLSARLEQDGELMALALAAFSVPWPALEVDELPMPQVAPPEPRPPDPIPGGRGIPRFLTHMVMQPRIGAVPFQGADAPMEVGGWLGLYEPQPLDAPVVALLTDAWLSPPFVRVSAPHVSPTIDLTIHFRRALPRPGGDDEELVLAGFRTRLVHDGFFENDAVIWAPDGSVLAQARQLALLMASPPGDDSPAARLG
jgi:acyl-CoA thioesterase